MKVFKYNRREAITNACYSYMAIAPKRYFILFCLLPVILLIVVAILLADFLTFGATIIIVIFIMFFIPIAYSMYFANNNGWFSRAFVLDDKDVLWSVQQFNSSYSNKKLRDDNEFISIMEKYKSSKSTNRGIAIKLKDIKVIQDTKKYYICSYQDKKQTKQIKILKAYQGLKEILENRG